MDGLEGEGNQGAGRWGQPLLSVPMVTPCLVSSAPLGPERVGPGLWRNLGRGHLGPFLGGGEVGAWCLTEDEDVQAGGLSAAEGWE